MAGVSKYSTKPALDPDRQILVTLKQSQLLKLAGKAETAGVSTHEWAREALIAASK